MITVGLSAILSFLPVLGPMIAGMTLANVSNKWPLTLTRKVLLFKAICLFCGLIGLLFVWVILFKEHGLMLGLNTASLVITFFIVNLPDSKKEVEQTN